MGRLKQAWALMGILGVAAVVFPVHAPMAAKKAQSDAKAQPAKDSSKKADPAAAAKQLETGIKAYEAEKYDSAIQALSQALRGGALASQQVAKALYYRGLSYRKQGKPALAIADLTSAVWLKGGLSDAERADAQENRAAAYKEAGLSEAPASAGSSGTSAPASTGLPATAANWQTSTSETRTTTAVSTSTAQPGSGSGIAGFFSNLFGGSSQAAAEPPPRPKVPTSTASTQPAPVAVSAWSDATEVSAAGTRTAALSLPAAQPERPAAAPQPAPAAKAAPARSGKYRLQVAAVRSREEAETLASRLKVKHGPAIGPYDLAVDEVVLGNMGTFYRVRLGPFADANEPRQLCGSLKADGFDCLIVTK